MAQSALSPQIVRRTEERLRRLCQSQTDDRWTHLIAAPMAASAQLS
jgi:hypothetical protein